MQKVIVIGCPGSGKSTFSRALSQKTDLPLFHLDMLYWNADRTTVEKSVFLSRLSEILSLDKWIIDGNYNSTMEMRLRECDTVIFLDYPLDVCIEGAKNRRGKPRSDMPWIEDENEVDEEFLEFINNFSSQSRPQILSLLEKYPDKKAFVFKNRNEAQTFLKGEY